MASITRRTSAWAKKDGTKRERVSYQARYEDDHGNPHSQNFKTKKAAQEWLTKQTGDLQRGVHISPRMAATTVDAWCDTWLQGYSSHREGTVRQAEVHLKRIRAEFGTFRMGDVRPSMVKAWIARMKAEGLSDSYVSALHGRLIQLYRDAMDDDVVVKSPANRKTAPKGGEQKIYVLTPEQVIALHDAAGADYRPAILLAAFAGARIAEVGGMKIEDLDLMRGVWTPGRQYPSKPLKTGASEWPVPFGQTLALELAVHIGNTVDRRKGDWVVIDKWGSQLSPVTIQREMRRLRSAHAEPRGCGKECTGCLVPGLPDSFSFHDFRHFFASMLIASGADIKKVQKAMRHATPMTTLRIYGHLWPDADDTIRSASDAVLSAFMAPKALEA